MSELSAKDFAILSAAVSQLERPSLAVRLAAVVGMPVEKLLGWLPDSIQSQIDHATEEALAQALKVASKTLHDETLKGPRNLTHKVAVTLSGVTGGLFGAPALFAELPVTTVIILRSIGDIARSKGEDLSDPTVQLACLEVLALGSEGKQDSAGVTGASAQREESYIRSSYFLSRAAMAQQVTAAAEILTKGTTSAGSSALTRLISRIASRFGMSVSEKVAAQAVPIVGAIGGGLINALFMDHFQNTAEAHFSIRKLERVYGAEVIRREYERLAQTDT
jgi:EcsC family protein